MTETPLTGLALLRSPFPDHLISKLPKETKNQTEQRKKEMDAGRWPDKCGVCGGLHHKNAVHLDYVGHAALTHRLLDVDPEWSWEPMAFRDGLPAFDSTGGLWIKLTVLGVSRLGYGHAAAKPGMDPGSREKEVIGDALRNAAMRFGAALDLWHKGDLHADDDTTAEPPARQQHQQQQRPQTQDRPAPTLSDRADAVEAALKAADTPDLLAKTWAKASGLCADLDLKDPDRLATLTALHEGLRDEMDANPFSREAA